jgi:hypothetical protein
MCESAGQQAAQDELHRLRGRMDEVLHQELMWLQRSRVDWLQAGDRNTKFFHMKAAGRARRNSHTLKKRGWLGNATKKEMEHMARGFFSNLYQADQQVCPEEVLHLFQPAITDTMNDEQCRDFSNEEIGDALFQMGSLKAPGPDRFLARFFQHNWETLREDIIRGVKNFFDTGVMPEGINDTVIVLIPKKRTRIFEGFPTHLFMQCGI